MTPACDYPQCHGSVPAVLESQSLCALHFLRKIEAQCVEIRREALVGRIDGRRKTEIHQFLFSQALVLAQLATSGTRLGDEARPCILNVFLTLINVCERVARSGEEEVRGPVLVESSRRLVAAGAK